MSEANPKDPSSASSSSDPKQNGSDFPNEYGLFPRSKPVVNEEELYSFRIRPEENVAAGPAVSTAVSFLPGSKLAPTNLPPERQAPGTVADEAAQLMLPFGLQALVDSATGKRSPALVLGLAFGIPILLYGAFFGWHSLKPRAALNDMGAAVYKAGGLKGHLVAKWAGKAVYQLRIESLSAQDQAEFAAVAGAPPRALSVNLRLLDPSGFVVCGKEVLFKFDRSAASPEAVAANGKSDSLQAAMDRTALLGRQVAEQERESEKDLFENELDANGKVVAVNAQGELPCSAQQYDRLDYWDFSTNFPLLGEQATILNSHGETPKIAPARRNEGKDASSVNHLPAVLDADDVITTTAPSRGVVQTSGGKIFLVDKMSLMGSATGWQVFPAPIHYRCDQTGNCVITRPGTTATLHGRLRR